MLCFAWHVRTAHAQQQPLLNRLTISTEPRWGAVMPHHDYMAYFIRQNVTGFRLNIGLQTDGSKDWHIRFRLPVVGLGYYCSNLGNTAIYGHLHGLYGYFDNHFLQPHHRLNIGNRISFGLSYATKHFDINQNPRNYVLSTGINVFFQYDILLRYKATPHFSIALLTGLTHASNGNYREPNKGFNLLTAGLELRYSLKPQPTPSNKHPQRVSDSTQIAVLVGILGGTKAQTVANSHRYDCYGFSTELQYRIGPASIVGIEFDAYRDNSIKFAYEKHIKSTEGFSNSMYYRVAIYPTYIIHAARVGISLQPGIYLNTGFIPHGRFTYKLGLRYQIMPDIFASMAVKTHYFGNADFVEFALRYRFKITN